MTSTVQRRDKWIPWYFVMFFVVIALVNAVMVTLAIRTHSGIVTEHPYEKGLAYNRIVEAEEKQAALGWKSDITYMGDTLRFTLYDKNHHPIALEKATAIMTRPTQAGMDFTIDLHGNEATTVAFPVKGLWEIRVEATAHGQTYQQAKRIVVP